MSKWGLAAYTRSRSIFYRRGRAGLLALAATRKTNKAPEPTREELKLADYLGVSRPEEVSRATGAARNIERIAELLPERPEDWGRHRTYLLRDYVRAISAGRPGGKEGLESQYTLEELALMTYLSGRETSETGR